MNKVTSIATGRFVQDTAMLIREHEANDAMAARLSLGKPTLEGLPADFPTSPPCDMCLAVRAIIQQERRARRDAGRVGLTRETRKGSQIVGRRRSPVKPAA